MTRSTGRVRTGIGSARQDVNVSVTGGTRVEIKGVPRIPLIPLLTYNEAKRQWNLLRMREELRRRGITGETFRSATETVTRLVRKTRFTPVRDAVAAGLEVHCVLLRGFRGLLRWETQTDTFFSREISDRVRVIACLTTLPNIIHSDNPSESLATSEWQAVRKLVNASDDDTMVLVWGDHEDAATGASEIAIRAREAAVGIPSETRQALRDGTNGFERILPGADRMYPDTDLPPKRIAEERLDRIRATLPLEYWSRESAYRAQGVPGDLVRPLAMSPHAPLFEELTRRGDVPAVFAASVIIRLMKQLRRSGHATDALDAGMLQGVLLAHASGRLAREGVPEVLKQACARGGFDASLLPGPVTETEARGAVTAAIAGLAGTTIRRPERTRDLVMGLVMPELRGRIEGASVARIVGEGIAS
jgi:glutamyl-tRNA(Gln) amidotransferase subunit E